MGHLMDSGTPRCTEPTHLQRNDPCTHLAMYDVNGSVEVRKLDGDDLREIALGLAHRYLDAANHNLPTRAKRCMELLESLGLLHLQHLKMDL